MKLKRYLVFAWETSFRMGGDNGGWNDLLDSFDTLEKAIERGRKYFDDDPARHLELPHVFQIVDLNTGLAMTVRDGLNSQDDCARLLEVMKPNEMDRTDRRWAFFADSY